MPVAEISKKTVIALGGSIAFPEEVNTEFLQDFSSLIREEVRNGRKFIIVVGGGYITRKYQNAASDITEISEEDKDWIGVHATRLNAHFLRTLFKEEANPVVFDERRKVKKFGKYPVIIGSGWQPGWSTDFVSVQIAVDFNIDRVICLGKPSYVLAPAVAPKQEKVKTASLSQTKTVAGQNPAYYNSERLKPVSELSWEEYLKIIPSEWSPGLHVPVDPVGAKLAKKENIKAVVANGENLQNFKNILERKEFKGTLLS